MLKTIIKNPLTLIIISCFLIFFAEYPALFLIKYGIFNYKDISFQLIDTLNVFVMLFILPSVAIKIFFKKSLSDFGLSFPVNIKQSAILTGLVILIFLLPMYFLAQHSDFKNFYSVKTDLSFFLLYTTSGIFYFFAEEFIFRGLLHFGLWDRFKFHTFWIINIIFAIFHYAKPTAEIYFSLIFGLSLSFLSYKTKSFIPAFIAHFILALSVNILVTFIFLK